MEKKANWYIKGEYLEACNCDVVCLAFFRLTPQRGDPTYGHCDLMCNYFVDEGEYEGVDISGLAHVIMCYTPREMKWHDWSIAHYYDSKATPEQREAMLTIFKGKVGGPAADLNACMAIDLGTSPADIKYERISDSERLVSIEGVYTNHAKAKQGMQFPDQQVMLENIHPQCYALKPAYA
jgi:hypothetical protein